MHLLTQSALLRALGWSLFNSLWQMSLLWAFYYLFLRLFTNAPARARHGLALLLLTIGACWSAVTFATAYFDADSLQLSLLLPAQGSLSRLMQSCRETVSALLPWCSSLYLLILGSMLVRYYRHYLLSRRLARTGLSKISPEFRLFVERTARHMGIRPAVSLHLSNLVDVPVTLGFLKPVILLPVAMLSSLTTQQVEAILVHELAHIRRKDYLLNLLITAMELLFFFNPFTRMLIGQLRKEREHCCDDQVLQFQYDPHAYVSALLSLARQHRHGRLAVAATGGGGDQLLLQRARKILEQKRTADRPGSRPFLLFFGTILLTAMTLGFSRPAAQDRPVPQRPLAPQLSVRTYIAAVHLVTPIPQAVRHRSLHHPAHASRPVKKELDQEPDEYSVPILNTADPDVAPAPIYADLVQIEKRDYSIGKTGSSKPAPQPKAGTPQESFPFVPNSSFSFQLTDTLSPNQKLALMEQLTEKEFRLQVARLQTQLKNQLDLLREQEAAIKRAAKEQARASLINPGERQLRELLEQQMRFQQEYLKNLEEIQRQLKHRSTTVYI